MRSVLFLVGFLVGIGGALIFLAAVASTVMTSVAWVNSVVVSQRTKAKEHHRRELALADRRARVVADRRARVLADRRARVASQSL
ncbi:MAG: hypothetical protein E6G34_05130 [Actinobacteria bacterium]|nr:MAG: hypothetical protein E6G34_05130 [Actinomycetota bacterium]